MSHETASACLIKLEGILVDLKVPLAFFQASQKMPVSILVQNCLGFKNVQTNLIFIGLCLRLW